MWTFFYVVFKLPVRANCDLAALTPNIRQWDGGDAESVRAERFSVECGFCQPFSVARKSEGVVIRVIGSKGDSTRQRILAGKQRRFGLMRLQIDLGIDQDGAKGLVGIPGCPPGQFPGEELALVGSLLRHGFHSVRRFDGGLYCRQTAVLRIIRTVLSSVEGNVAGVVEWH